MPLARYGVLAGQAFHHPLAQELAGLADGFTLLPSQAGGLALDFIRANLFDRQAMRPVPATPPGPTTIWPTRCSGSCPATGSTTST
jgi:uncharacterized protein YukJ